MSTYLYEALDKDNQTVRGEFDAEGKGEVLEHLLRRSLRPLSIHALREGVFAKTSFSFFDRLTQVDMLFLVRNLGTTIKAGLSIDESLDLLIADVEKPFLRSMLQSIQAGIKKGEQLSLEFERYKRYFPPAFIGMVKAGEISGQLDATFQSLSSYLSKEHQLRQQIRAALVYPIVLLFASGAVVALLLIVVLPRLAASFSQSGVKLPLITKIFIGMSNALTFSFTLDLVVVAALAWFFIYFRRTEAGTRLWQNILSQVPVAKELVQQVALVRMTRTLGNLLGSGISAIESVTITADTIGNIHYEEALRKSAKDLELGTTLSQSLEKSPNLYPRILVGLVLVGERTGTLSSILISLADFYDDEVGNRLKNLTAVLEPALLLVIGLIVGAIALSILLPIYQLVGSVG
jgi:type IV pilus assembly protein PilC